MPEVSLKTSHWVIKHLAQRGAEIHLDTQLTSAVDGKIELSTGETFESDLIVWTAGVMANPAVVRASDLPVEERGRLQHPRRPPRRRRRRRSCPTPGRAGDVAAVPDLTGGGVGGYCVPNAQHAVRQGKLLAKNIVAVLRGEEPQGVLPQEPGRRRRPRPRYDGVFQSGKIALKGLIAWFAHRGYHGLAMPSWERKFRVFWGWWNNFWLGRDIVSLAALQEPRAQFEQFAARPKPPAAAAPAPVAAAASGKPAPKAVEGQGRARRGEARRGHGRRGAVVAK